MSSRELHNVGLHTDWDLGEDGWKAGMDRNLLRLDTLVQARVLGVGENSPPPSPSEGDVYIIGESPTGVWSGYPHHVAVRDADDWAFIPPKVEWTMRNIGDGREYRFTGTRWVNDSTFVTALPNITALTSLNTEALVDGQQFSVKDGGQVRKFAWDEQAGDFQELTYAIRKPLSVEPTLSSNFRTGEHKLYGVQDGYKSRGLADIWDVTRASGETVLTPAGRIATVDPDTFPLTYVPETGGLGAQITGAATNLLRWSEDFTQNVWSKGNRVTVEEYSPSGSQPDSINLVVPTEVQGRHWLSQNPSITQSVGVTFSAFFKASGYDYVMVLATGIADSGNRATIDLQTGEIINNGDGVGASIKLSDGWYFFSVFMPASDAGSIELQISVHDTFTSSLRAFTGDGESGVYMWGAQLTEGSTLFPYVKTEASTVTKPATNVVRELGEEFNSREGTVIIDISNLASRGSDISNRCIFSIGGSLAGSIKITTDANDEFRFSIRPISGSTNQYIPSIAGRNLVAISWSAKESVMRASANGQVSSVSVSDPITGFSSNELALATGGVVSPAVISHAVAIGRFQYIPRALSESELAEQTRG